MVSRDRIRHCAQGFADEGNGLPSVYDLKPKFQNLLRPLCAAMARGGITANQVTASAAVMSIALGVVIAVTHGAAWTLFLLPPVLFVRMALNAIDGMLARAFNQKSRLGAVLNELGDVVSDTALYLPFALRSRSARRGAMMDRSARAIAQSFSVRLDSHSLCASHQGFGRNLVPVS